MAKQGQGGLEDITGALARAGVKGPPPVERWNRVSLDKHPGDRAIAPSLARLREWPLILGPASPRGFFWLLQATISGIVLGR
jgi:hypothetical protein